MTEKPILFSGPMVRALLDGRKTQTRRVVKPQPPATTRSVMAYHHADPRAHHWAFDGGALLDWARPCPYGQPGDQLWVRETWLPDPPHDGTWASTQFSGCENSPLTDIPKRFRTPEHCIFREGWSGPDLRWKPSIHMPRWASRILLEVKSVRVERLRDISEGDAEAEGIDFLRNAPDLDETLMPTELYHCLWDSLNAARGYGWNVNPWVWVVEFRRVANGEKT